MQFPMSFVYLFKTPSVNIQEDALWHGLFYTELTTGLQRGELCGLRREDSDAENGTLQVCRTVRREKGKGLTATNAQLKAAQTMGNILSGAI